MAESLKDQYDRIQQQQQKKLEKLKELQSKKSKSDHALSDKNDSAFGVEDNLDLLGTNSFQKSNKNKNNAVSESEVNEYKDRIRAMTDENGRLFKLISEKDYEIKQLKKKAIGSMQRPSELSASVMGSDSVASMKIVELSKKIREMTADLESEKTRSSQLKIKVSSLERELAAVSATAAPVSAKSLSSRLSSVFEDEKAEQSENKVLKDKVKKSEAKLSELRAQCQILTKDLNIAKKALGEELGDSSASVVQILSGQSNWRGRNQQIITLQNKVKDLEKQLKAQPQENLDFSFSGATTLGFDVFSNISSASTSRGATSNHNSTLQKMQKERKEAAERSEKELKALEADYNQLKSKLDGSLARAKSLSVENKAMKTQVQTLLEKGKNDDELISSLMKQQERMKRVIEDTLLTKSQLEASQQVQSVQILQQKDQESRVIERLKEIIQDKEKQIMSLQENSSTSRGVHSNPPYFGKKTDRVSSARSDLSSSSYHVPLSSRAMQNQPESPHISLSRPPSGIKFRSPSPAEPKQLQSSRSLNSSRNSQVPLFQAELEETRALCRAAEVERDRLRELVQVQDTRYQQILHKEMGACTELQSLKRRLPQMEKQLEKKGVKISAPTYVTRLTDNELEDILSMDINSSKVSKEHLHDALTMCGEEVASLRRALQSALQSKNEDLKMLTDIIAQTREQFLLGLKILKNANSHVTD